MPALAAAVTPIMKLLVVETLKENIHDLIHRNDLDGSRPNPQQIEKDSCSKHQTETAWHVLDVVGPCALRCGKAPVRPQAGARGSGPRASDRSRRGRLEAYAE